MGFEDSAAITVNMGTRAFCMKDVDFGFDERLERDGAFARVVTRVVPGSALLSPWWDTVPESSGCSCLPLLPGSLLLIYSPCQANSAHATRCMHEHGHAADCNKAWKFVVQFHKTSHLFKTTLHAHR